LDESIIKIDSVRFYWSKKSNFKIFVPNLEIKKGEKVLLLGESGSGKTTLLSLMCGFLNPLSGNISINGNTINQLSSKTRDEYRADNIGIIFQQFNLLPYANVVDNVLLPLYFSKVRSNNVSNKKEKVIELFKQLRLPDDIAQFRASSLSMGQQQRVAVARALIGNPSLIIADEPTSSLDADAQKIFLNLMFEQISENNSTLLMVSHDKSLSNQFDRLIDINEILIREDKSCY
jgi:putative ABC transport system ATP-binding protein|tara:strand:+ start:211 stop:909 length:699 start_codon:yes stop_codon:yes gene_type:complete